MSESVYPPQQWPTAIQFPINDICNSKCQMCNIWQQKKTHEITPDQVRQALADPLFAQMTDVGINGGEPTLRRDIAELVQALIESLPKLKTLYLITNAIREDQVTQAIGEMGARCRDGGVQLDVMVSLDGIGEVHDRVRGRKGNFESAVRVLDFVQQCDLVSDHRIGCTVIKENVFDCENVLDWCQARNVYARFRVGIPHRRLYSLDFAHPLALNVEEKFHFANFLDNLRLHYEPSRSRQQFYLSLRNQLIYRAPRAAGCAWKSHAVTLTSRGELGFCAVESPNLGDATTESAATLYWRNRAILESIQHDKCADCFHDYQGEMHSGSPLLRFSKLLGQSAINRLARTVKPLLPQTTRQAIGRTAARLTKKDLRKNLGSAEAGRIAALPVRPRDLPRRVLLCGWYGTETLGDKAILAGIVRQ
ncbi:MAG: radical SAM protein, partial [Pirellulales bacterium]|nr:radical SAM protein [Pirellulales bacterium]